MSKAILERPAPKESAVVEPKSPRCVTPWSIGRAWPVPAFPKRPRVQQVVTDDEREAAAELLATYREAERERDANDLGARATEIRSIEAARTITGEMALRIEELRQQMKGCDHQVYLSALSKLRELEEDAAELVKPILEHCVESFDDQLNAMSCEREAALDMMGIPLYQDTRAFSLINVAAMTINAPDRNWELHQNKELTFLHSMREVCRHIRECFNGERNRRGELAEPMAETYRIRAIPTLIHLCTDEPIEYSWL